jgi:predicted nucleic acid-binding protein
MAHAVNVCEVFYLILRSSDDTSALDAVHELVSIWVSVHEDMDSPFWQQVGRFKAVHGIPLADAFALALAGRAGADLVTSDHGDFDAIAGTGAFNINFIR